ncbi:MAG: hypothetical protein H7257_00770, partial [Taibaiella sp.]|nr:hypothetical protein [Taibaiella sp.]
METEHREVRQLTTIPAGNRSYRWIENAHILLWLLKDTFWAMEWRAGALIMVVPTLSVAFWLLWRSRKTITDLMHNLAVCLWISG